MSIAFGNRGKKEISDAEIIQRAKQLGMVDANDTELEEVNISDTEIVVESESMIPTSSENSDKENKSEKETEKNFNSGSINGLTNQNTVSDSNIVEKENEKKDNNKKEDKNDKEDEKSDNVKDGKENMISASENDSQKPEYVSFTIKRGQVCRQIAENLQKQGLVDDADAFREYMARNGLASNIRCGTFDIPKGATYQELAKFITTK